MAIHNVRLLGAIGGIWGGRQYVWQNLWSLEGFGILHTATGVCGAKELQMNHNEGEGSFIWTSVQMFSTRPRNKDIVHITLSQTRLS